MERNRARLAELAALFAAADEEDYEDANDAGVLPPTIKASRPNSRNSAPRRSSRKKEGEKGNWSAYTGTRPPRLKRNSPATKRFSTKNAHSTPPSAPPRKSRKN